MFYKMRRADRQLPESEAIKILEVGEYGVFSSISTNGYPYGVPVNYVFIKNSIYFHCAANEGHKLDNIQNDNRVSFCVVGKTQVIPNEFSTKYESVIVFGRAVKLTEHEKKEALIYLLEKYSPGYINKGKKYVDKDASITDVIKIEIEYMTGKAKR